MTPVNRHMTEFGIVKMLSGIYVNLRNTVAKFQLRTIQLHQVIYCYLLIDFIVHATCI